MRTKEEFDEMFEIVGARLEDPELEDDEILQAVFEALRWANGETDKANLLAYLPE